MFKLQPAKTCILTHENETQKFEFPRLTDDLPPRTRVELHSLKNMAMLNGERAVVLGRDPTSGRMEIRLEIDGSTKQVKRSNLKVI